MLVARWIVAALFSPAISMAVVDMRNANVAKTETFMKVPGSGFDMSVELTYNSRSLFNGMFGFGWCSDPETRLEITAENNLKLKECGGGLEVFYYPSLDPKKTEQAAAVNKSIDLVIAEMKRARPGMDEKELSKRRAEMLENEEARSRYAREAGIRPNVKAGTVFYANGSVLQSIVLDGDFYVRRLGDGTVQKFNREGQLALVQDANSNILRMVWEKGRLVRITDTLDNTGRKIEFEYGNDKSLKVSRITGTGGLVATFSYKGDDLVQAVSANKETFRYDYDRFHNVTKITYPDKSSEEMTYNEDKDWVMAFKDRAGCKEAYSYNPSEDDPMNHYTSKVEKKCNGEVVNQATYEFWHKDNKDGGGPFLLRVRTESTTEVVDVTYHEKFGKPVVMTKNGFTTNYAYAEDGLLKTKSTAQNVFEYEYNKQTRKVTRVLTSFKDEKGKVARKRKTEFEYDARGNLIYAHNDEGQRVWLSYDKRGRIATIKDQAKKIVEIAYDDRFANKPSIVKRPGLGTIVVKYTNDGTIERVDSKEGPSVAVQVASTFNNLLDVIAPATSDSSLSI